MRTRIAYGVTWLVAVVLATAVGFSAINLVGDVLRGSGPIGANLEAPETTSENASSPAPRGPPRRDTFTYAPLTVTVECRGGLALLLGASPGPGWRIAQREDGPDEDVDATAVRRDRDRDRVFTIEVYCNRGYPTPVIEVEFD